jgi:hypothetical protein
MIQNFTRRVLDGFSRLYGVVGQVGRVNAIDVSPPTMVHDVSAEAHLSGGFYTEISVSNTTGGAGADSYAATLRSAALANAEIAAKMSEAGLNAAEVDVWLVGLAGIAATAGIANFNRLRLGINQGTLTGGGMITMLKRFATAEVAMVSGGVTFLKTDLGDTQPFGAYKLPIFIPDDTTSAFLTQATDGGAGAVTAIGIFQLWVGPKGCPPPGLN